MSKASYLGVDIGTWEAKGVLVDSDGAIVAQARRPHLADVPAAGRMEHNAEEVWWTGFVELSRILSQAAAASDHEISGVCVSGIGPCVLPIGADSEPLRPAILYGVDGRASSQIARMRAALGDEEILARARTQLSSQSAGPKVLWVEDEEADIFRRTRLFVTCNTFIVGRLTGRHLIDHGTAAYFHPLYDRRASSWNLEGYPGSLREDQLPAIAWANQVAGVVRPDAARITGLPQGTPVLVGGADSPSEALSVGVVEPGAMMLMYGSSHFALTLVDTELPPSELWPAPYLWPGTYLLAGGTATAGSYIRWLRDVLHDKERSTMTFDDLAALAATSPPGANGLVALPYLSGERTPLFDPQARGVIFGLALDHSRGDIVRAAIEAVAQSAAALIRAFENASIYPSAIRAVGGGTKNETWMQAVSDMTGYPQEPVDTPGAAYGDAMLTAHAISGTPIAEVAARWLKPGKSVRPDPANRELYDKQRAVFDALYQCTRPLLVGLNELRPS